MSRHRAPAGDEPCGHGQVEPSRKLKQQNQKSSADKEPSVPQRGGERGRGRLRGGAGSLSGRGRQAGSRHSRPNSGRTRGVRRAGGGSPAGTWWASGGTPAASPLSAGNQPARADGARSRTWAREETGVSRRGTVLPKDAPRWTKPAQDGISHRTPWRPHCVLPPPFTRTKPCPPPQDLRSARGAVAPTAPGESEPSRCHAAPVKPRAVRRRLVSRRATGGGGGGRCPTWHRTF